MAVLLAQMGGSDDHMDWDAGSWWMVMTMLLFVAVVIGVIVWAVITTTRHTHHTNAPAPQAPLAPHAPNARAILDERFARGEIDSAEYEERRRILG